MRRGDIIGGNGYSSHRRRRQEGVREGKKRKKYCILLSDVYYFKCSKYKDQVLKVRMLF